MLIDSEAVIKAVDRHTRDDGTLDEDISIILEEIPASELWEYKDEHTRVCKNCRMTYISYNGWKERKNEL